MLYSYIARSRRAAVAEPLEARRLLAGQLDTSFGPGGLGYADFNNRLEEARAVAVQADDKIVAAGSASVDSTFGGDFAVARFLPSGAPDTSFGGAGGVRLDWGGEDGAEAVAIQPDGKIVVGGWVNHDGVNANFGVARLLPDGSPDPAFGTNGRVVTDFQGRTDQLYDLVLQPDGKILAAGVATTGSHQLALARYNPDGSLDQLFGAGGKVLATVNGNLSYAFAVALQNDGKIVTTGTASSGGSSGGVRTLSISRFRADGTVDPTFGTGGWIVDNLGIAFPTSIAVAPDGGYYVGVTVATTPPGGARQHHTHLRKYTATGARAAGFGTDGGVQVAPGGFIGFPTEVVVRSDGQVLVAATDGGSGVGSYGAWAVAAVTPAGALRPDFGTGGRVVTSLRTGGSGAAMALDSAGRIVVAGYSEGDMAVGRYTNDPVGTVFGTVFRDVDGDELQDPEDGPLAGWRVYADSNNNAVLDAGERTATTDATGRYEFRQLFAGSYVFRLAMQPGHVSGLASVQLPAVPGQATQLRPWPVIRGAMIVGWVFNDLNRNGQMDNGEPPLVGTVVYVDADGDRRFDPGERNVRVDGSGLYRIALDVPGTASVRQVVPPGYRQVTPAEDADQRASAEPGQAYGSRNFVNIPQPVTVTSTSYGPAREWISFQFDRRMDLATLNMSRFTLTNVATGQTYTEFNENFTIGWPTTVTLEVAPGRLPTGNYRAVLRTGAISDYSGNTLPADVVLDFFVLDGDVNRDRSVNGTDFAILAGNFGRTGQTYATGDLNGDGAVNGTDFAILAGNFGKTVAAPAVQPAAAPVRQQAVQPQPAVLRRKGRVRRDPRDPRTLRGRSRP